MKARFGFTFFALLVVFVIVSCPQDNLDVAVYSVNINQPIGGTISADCSGGPAGTAITLSNMPGSGYTFSHYTVDGEINTSGSFTLNKDVTVSGVFTPTVPTVPTAASPAADIAEGAYTSPLSVTLSCATEGADIYYTVDGTTPTAGSTRYTGAISISETTTLKAIAVKDGMNNSGVMSVHYIINTGSQPHDPYGFTYAGMAATYYPSTRTIEIADWQTPSGSFSLPAGVTSVDTIVIADNAAVMTASHLYDMRDTSGNPNGVAVNTGMQRVIRMNMVADNVEKYDPETLQYRTHNRFTVYPAGTYLTNGMQIKEDSNGKKYIENTRTLDAVSLVVYFFDIHGFGIVNGTGGSILNLDSATIDGRGAYGTYPNVKTAISQNEIADAMQEIGAVNALNQTIAFPVIEYGVRTVNLQRNIARQGYSFLNMVHDYLASHSEKLAGIDFNGNNFDLDGSAVDPSASMYNPDSSRNTSYPTTMNTTDMAWLVSKGLRIFSNAVISGDQIETVSADIFILNVITLGDVRGYESAGLYDGVYESAGANPFNVIGGGFDDNLRMIKIAKMDAGDGFDFDFLYIAVVEFGAEANLAGLYNRFGPPSPAPQVRFASASNLKNLDSSRRHKFEIANLMVADSGGNYKMTNHTDFDRNFQTDYYNGAGGWNPIEYKMWDATMYDAYMRSKDSSYPVTSYTDAYAFRDAQPDRSWNDQSELNAAFGF